MTIILKTSAVFTLFVFVMFSSGCNSLEKLPLTEIYASNQCATKQTSIELINDQAKLQTIINKNNASLFLATPMQIPELDFEHVIALQINAGQKNTAGYNIVLTEPEASLKQQSLYLPIEIQAPDKKLMQAQMISSPCKIFSLPKADFTKIIINEELFLDLTKLEPRQ